MATAAPAHQEGLLALQELDTRLDRLAQQRAKHPSIEKVNGLADELAAAELTVQEAEEAATQARRAVTAAENEAETLRGRREKDQAKLDSGTITTPRELQGLQHEIETLTAKLETVEDTELEAMEAAEEAQTAAAAAVAHRDALAASLDAAVRERDEAFATIDEESRTLAESRRERAEGLPEDLLGVYDKSRQKHRGVGAAALRQLKCEGCRIELNRADLAEIRQAAQDTLLRCPECGRILVRTPESGL